jgi:hypothetical protein
MAIGRSEDRDTPWDPMVLRYHFSVWDPIRVTHLGPRSSDRTTQAGHMTATDQRSSQLHILARRGPSTYGSPQPNTDIISAQHFWTGGLETAGPGCYDAVAIARAAAFRMLGIRRIRHAAIVP